MQPLAVQPAQAEIQNCRDVLVERRQQHEREKAGRGGRWPDGGRRFRRCRRRRSGAGQTGWLYAEAPFIFFCHGYPNDFTRFTREGLRQLFDGLEDVQLGLTNGPVSATLRTVNTLLQFPVPRRLPWLLKAVRGAYGGGRFR